MFVPGLALAGIEIHAPDTNAVVLEQYLVANRTQLGSAR